MNKKALQTLEYDKIIKRLIDMAISPMGKEMAASLLPMNNILEITRAQNETSEAASFIARNGSLPLGGIKDIRSSLNRSRVGGILSIRELLAVSDFIYVCRKVISYNKNFAKNEDNFPLLTPLFIAISSQDDLEKEITRCIINEEELADDASQKLYEIRRTVKTANDRIREQLNSIIHSQNYKNMLQDTVITIRNERFCVPVKLEYRNSFNGMVHDQSSTGATVFMEPMAVVQLNNKIKELRSDEKDEIEAVLKKLSLMVMDVSELLEANLNTLALLDFVFAKGELSLTFNASMPILNVEGKINLKKARHPLLAVNEVVPTDIYLGQNFTTLLITGPNTGGKTVALKTLGLFCLMGQAGLHIPAFDNSELAVFDEVFADIGDEQSIEQSLSTFSSHMKNIIAILKKVTNNSLVLLDELGAGTDPTEGAALAVSILTELLERKIRTAVTTHYSELKIYAISTDGVENASCEFDVTTLKPTFHLLIGIPGKSNAFAISRRLGLPENIIERSKEVLTREDVRFEDVITDLEIYKKTVILEKERAESFRKEAELSKNILEKQKQKLEVQREKIIKEAKDEAAKLTRDAKDEASRLLKEYQKQLRSNNTKEAEVTRKILTNKSEALDKEANEKAAPILQPLPLHVKNGDRVFIHTLNQSGSIISPPDQNGEVLVQVGIMKARIHKSNLSLDESVIPTKKEISFHGKPKKSISISPDLDLRGCLVEDALLKADKYLDDAFLSGLSRVTIIHGKGTGALRSAIQDYLQKRKHIKSFRYGEFGEGDTGVTIVEIE